VSKLEETLAFQLKAVGLKPEREYKFHPTRKWRVDFAFPALKIGVEVEGGIWIAGRHSGDRGLKDTEKYNAAGERVSDISLHGQANQIREACLQIERVEALTLPARPNRARPYG
jgi:hypothetical protein